MAVDGQDRVSTWLQEASTARTRIARSFDPEAVARLRATAARDVAVGGPELAAHAITAGLVAEGPVFLTPSMVGGGRRMLPARLRIPLELLDERRFRHGMVYLRYRGSAPTQG